MTTEIIFPDYSLRLNIRKDVELEAEPETPSLVYTMWQAWNAEADNVYVGGRNMTGADAGIMARLVKKYDPEVLREYFHAFWMRYASRLNTRVPPMVSFVAVLPDIEQEFS